MKQNDKTSYIKKLFNHRVWIGIILTISICIVFYLIISGFISFPTSNENVNRIINIALSIAGIVFYCYHLLTSLKLFKYPIISKVDFIALYTVVGIITLLFCFCVQPITLTSSCLYIFIALGFLSVCFWLGRIILYSWKIHKPRIKNDKITLIDLYNNNLKQVEGQSIAIDTNPIDGDIFERDYFREQLIGVLDNNGSKGSLVVGLNGGWGSGKTSLLNAVHKRLEKDKYEWIEFKPWGYNNFSELIEALYTEIISHTPFNHSFVSNQYLRYVKAAFANIDSSTTKLLSVLINDKVNYKSLQADINEILRTINKRIIIVIDDFDRLIDSFQISIMPLLHNFLGFDNCTYILSYEKSHIVTNYNDPKFVDKVIDYEVKIPNISINQRQNVIKTCLINTLQFYLGKISISDYNNALEYAYNKIENIRDLVLLVNSLQVLQYCKNSGLYMPELIGILFLKALNLELYSNIESNKEYFITSALWNSQNIDGMLTRPYTYVGKMLGQEFFDFIFKNERHALNLLGSMFPYVKEYKGTLKYPDNHITPMHKDTYTNCRIDNIEYFDAYFEVFDSYYLKVNNEIKELRTAICAHSSSSLDDAVDMFKRCIKNLDANIFFIRWNVQQSVSDLEKFAFIVAMMDIIDIYDHVEDIEDSSLYVGGNFRSYINYNINIFDNYQYADYFVKHCFKLKNIKYLLALEHNYINNMKTPQLLIDEYQKLKHELTNKKIDLFDDEYYRPGVFSIVFSLISGHSKYGKYNNRSTEDPVQFWRSYCNEVVDKEKHIYKLILDILLYCDDNSKNDELNNLFGDIDRLLENNPPKTQLEQQIYEKWISNKNIQ